MSIFTPREFRHHARGTLARVVWGSPPSRGHQQFTVSSRQQYCNNGHWTLVLVQGAANLCPTAWWPHKGAGGYVQCLHGNDLAASSAVCRNLCSSFPGPSCRPHLPPSWASLRHPRGLRVLNHLALSCQGRARAAILPPPVARSLDLLRSSGAGQKKENSFLARLGSLVHVCMCTWVSICTCICICICIYIGLEE